MYNSKYDGEYEDERNFIKRNLIWVVLLCIVLSIVGWVGYQATRVVDTAFINYSDFQEIYNTCQKIDNDLSTIRKVPESDRMFESFSKAALIANKKQQMTRWAQEYNAKSKLWHKAMWKSRILPYQLDPESFPNYLP